MQKNKKSFAKIILALMVIFALAIPMSAFAADETADAAVLTIGATEEIAAETAFTLGEGEDAIDYDLTDGDSALEYVGGYADNLEADPDFKVHLETALAKVRESISQYATIWAMLPPIVAIALALITKEVYSSLIIGIIVGGLIYSGGNFETTINHVISDGFVANVADSYNMGIIIFLILLGALVSMMNKADDDTHIV